MAGSLTVTLSTALADASHFNVILAHQQTYQPYLAAMKAANPKLQIFVYLNGTFTPATTLPESYYSHDASGNRIHTLAKPITYLLNPVSPDAIVYQQRRAADRLRVSGYDGLFLDLLGPAPLSTSYVSSVPINPATGQVWTIADWLKATTNIAVQLKTSIAPRPLIGNGFRAAQIAASGIPGSLFEAWLRPPHQWIYGYPSEASWKRHIDGLIQIGAGDASVLTMTKVWTTGTQSQKNAWFKFALASYLLGNDGKSYFFFSYQPGDSTVDYPLYHLDLGAALGVYAKVDGVYQRAFAKGKVLVNPTTSTFTVSLGGTYRTLGGATVTSVTLPPHTAEIVRS